MRLEVRPAVSPPETLRAQRYSRQVPALGRAEWSRSRRARRQGEPLQPEPEAQWE